MNKKDSEKLERKKEGPEVFETFLTEEGKNPKEGYWANIVSLFGCDITKGDHKVTDFRVWVVGEKEDKDRDPDSFSTSDHIPGVTFIYNRTIPTPTKFSDYPALEFRAALNYYKHAVMNFFELVFKSFKIFNSANFKSSGCKEASGLGRDYLFYRLSLTYKFLKVQMNTY